MTSRLSLNYDPIPSKKQCFKKPEVLYAFLYSCDIDDYDKLSKFLFLEKGQFYSVYITAHKVIDEIRKFLKYVQKSVYISVVEYDSSDPEMVYGNHFIIGSDENNTESEPYPFAPNKFLGRQTLCLVNYDRVRRFDKEYRGDWPGIKIQYDSLSDRFPCDKILLGKKVCKAVSISDNMYSSQLRNLNTITLVDSFMISFTLRLQSVIAEGLKGTDDKDFEDSFMISLTLHLQSVIAEGLKGTDDKDFDIVIRKLHQQLHYLQAETMPLEIQRIMITIANLLVNFVDTYYDYLRHVYNGGENIHNIDDIRNLLSNINATINHQDYEMINGVFCCRRFSGCDYSTPAIHSSYSRFTELLAIFKPNKFTFLKFKTTNNYAEENWFIQKNADEDIELVSFACFDVTSSNQSDKGFDLPFISACCHEPDTLYHWICVQCQKLVKISARGKIKCECGIGSAPLADPECLKCGLKRGTFQSPFVTDEVICDVPFTFKENTESVEATIKQPVWAKCEHNEKVTVKKDIHDSIEMRQPSLIHSEVPSLVCPDVPRLTVLVIGRAESNISNIMDSICHGQGINANLDPFNKCIVNYREYEVEYEIIVLKNRLIDWTLYPEIHGFIFVVENKVSPMSSIVERNLRNMLGMIPRSGVKNCCIVNCLVPNSAFTMADASKQLLAFVHTFSNVHGLTDCIHHFCVDKSVVLNHEQNAATDNSYKGLLNSIETSIEQFIIPVAESPVTMNELKIAEYLTQLGKLLDQQSIESKESKRLMASIADKTMSDAALCYRKHLATSVPLSNDEWKSAEELDIDTSLLKVIRKINKYMESENASALEKITSTSIFAMITDPIEPESQTETIQNVPAMTVETVVQSIPPTPTTEKPTYNVVMLGSCLSNKQLLLNIINGTVKDPDKTAFQDSDDYVMDYSTHAIRFINKDELNFEQYDIHGIIVVIENNALEWSNSSDNQIREAFSRLPRHATRNCCIVNTFTPSEAFALKDAKQQMLDFLQTFCTQHELTDSPSFVCFDVTTMNRFLNRNDTIDVEVCQRYYESGKEDITNFLQKMQTVKPITPKDLQKAVAWKRLCNAFRPHVRNRDFDTLRLMATIADHTLVGLAIYCRKCKSDVQALCGDEWAAATDHWNSKDANVSAVLQELLSTI